MIWRKSIVYGSLHWSWDRNNEQNIGASHSLYAYLFFFNFLAGAPTTEINSLIFKYPALKKNNYQEEVSIDFILFFYFIPVCGTRSYCIFIADDC